MANYFSLTNNYRLEPKRNNLFTLVLESVPGVGNDTATIEKLQIDLEKASRPSYGYGTLTLERFNMKYKVAQAPTFDHTLSVTFRDTVQLNLGRIFYFWNKAIFNPRNGIMGYAAGYKTDGALYIFDPLGNTIEKWKFMGMWPSATNWGEVTYGAGDALKVEVTFTYDLAYLDETVDSSNMPNVAKNATNFEAKVKGDNEVAIPNSV